MAYARMSVLGLGAALLSGCPDTAPIDETTGASSTTTSSTSVTNITATTIPLPTVSTSDDGGSTSEADTTDGGSTSSGTTDPTAGTEDTSGSTSGHPTTATGDPVYVVEWCRLQYPPMVAVDVGEAFTVYVRLYVPGLTDQSTGNDPAPELVVELGHGIDGSDPSTGMGAPWTYVAATPNPGWDDVVEPNNDEYQGDLSIDTAGIYDYAARISGDGGMSWVYCDLDDLLTGGYTPDQAGHAEVGQV